MTASRGCASAASACPRTPLVHFPLGHPPLSLRSEGAGALPRPQVGTAARSPIENDAHSAKNLRRQGAAGMSLG